MSLSMELVLITIGKNQTKITDMQPMCVCVSLKNYLICSLQLYMNIVDEFMKRLEILFDHNICIQDSR